MPHPFAVCAKGWAARTVHQKPNPTNKGPWFPPLQRTQGWGTLCRGDISKNKTHEGRATRPPNGATIPIPEGASGPFPVNNGAGFQYNGGAGGNGLAFNVTDVRIMDPNALNPTGYVNYGSAQVNGGWQTVNPYTGQSVPSGSFWWHIPMVP